MTAVELPTAFVAVSVYVVEAVGLTETLVPATVPTPWSMLRLVAPVTDQDKVLLWPVTIPAGLAVKLAMVGLLPATVTVAVSVVLPAALVAVRV